MIPNPRRSAFFAAVAALVGLAGGFAAAGWTNDYFVIAIDSIVVANTPGRVVNWTIENLGEEGHLLHVTLSFALAAALLSGIAGAGVVAAQRTQLPRFAGAAAATIATATAVLLLAGVALPAVASAVSVGAVVAIGEFALDTDAGSLERTDGDRRRAVGTIAGAIAYSAIATSVGRRTTDRALNISGRPLPESHVVDEMLDEAAATDLEIDGVEPPVSPVGTFFNVDINSTPPAVDADDWTLTIGGAVANDVSIDYDDLREQPVEHRYMALRCIGEDLNESLLDTAVWTGTPLTHLLQEADPQGDYVELHAADGYVTTFSRSFLDDAMIAYGMNGELLPRQHGYPARALLPGSWGKLNAKWLEEIRIVEEDTVGYWEDQGWEGEAPITTVAKLWTDPANELDDGRLEVGGHAYAGTRGIERVEVSTDGGDSWNEAELAEPLPGEDVTRQWRYRYEAAETHEVVVRAVDGTGEVQPEEESGSFPDGATGWVRATVEVES